MITTEGQTIVGYRYGEAPEGGRSWNYREKEWEPGVSMAQVGFDKEIGSFAVMGSAETRKKCYYAGTICGQTGGDGEICLSNVRRITRNEYLSLRKEMVAVSNQIVNDRIDRLIDLVNRGWNVGHSIDELEAERNMYLK